MASINITLDTVNETNRRGYTYRDVDYNFVLDARGYDFNNFDDINAIRNGLVNIFSWRRGERIILPEFGNTLYRFLYEPRGGGGKRAADHGLQQSGLVWSRRNGRDVLRAGGRGSIGGDKRVIRRCPPHHRPDQRSG